MFEMLTTLGYECAILRFMLSRFRTVLGVLACAAAAATSVLVACSSSPVIGTTKHSCKDGGCSETDDASVSTPDLTAEAVCKSVAEAYAVEAARCYPAFFDTIDRKRVVERRQLGCEINLATPGTGETLERVAQCARDRATIACEEVFTGGVPASCEPIGGTLTNGQPCLADSQCANKRCRYGSAESSCGVCTGEPKEGEDCADGYYCPLNLSCISGKCSRYPGAGAACTDYCVSSQYVCFDKRCQHVIGAGASCATGQPGDLCDSNAHLQCNATTHTCTKNIVLKEGERCEVGTVCPPDTSRCVQRDPDAGGPLTCEAHLAADGERCGFGPFDNFCASPARCISGICTLPIPGACN